MPKDEARDTKEVILTVALRLFSERGYDGVGIRDIAKEIGIRDSALYKHYSGKRDIFDSILKDIERHYQEEIAAFYSSEHMDSVLPADRDGREELFRISITMFQFYLKTEYGAQLRRMLTMEQYKASLAGRFFRELIIDEGLEYIAELFAGFIRDGVYIDADPMVLALQFYSPLYLLLSKYDNQPERYEEALAFLEKHVRQFNKSYARDANKAQ